MAGAITPAYHAIQSRWKQIRGQEYRPPPRYLGDKTSHIPASSKHKHDCQSAPKELLRPPNPRQTAKKLKPPETPEESPRSAGSMKEPWRPIGYHPGGVLPKSSPFFSPSRYPVPDWSIRPDSVSGEKWILKPKDPVVEEKILVPKWVPAGNHRITTCLEWSEERQTFQRTPLRQWSSLDPADEAVNFPSVRPATALGHGAGDDDSLSCSLNSSLSLSKDLGERGGGRGGGRRRHLNRPLTAVAHTRPWSPGGALHRVIGDPFDNCNTKYAHQSKW